MPRSIRIEYPGAYYHVMARGNRREAIFHDEADRRFFLQTLGLNFADCPSISSSNLSTADLISPFEEHRLTADG